MSLLEDLLVEDLDDPNELEVEEENNELETNELNENVEVTGEKVEPKKRVIKNPQPKLNADRLRGPRGIATIEQIFKDVKLKGKGHEEEDLEKVMWRLKHWCHRLYPKFQFDDCLNKIEKLGSKKVVKTYVNKIRQGIVDIEEPSAMDLPNDLEVLPPTDAFDELLDEQIANIPL